MLEMGVQLHEGIANDLAIDHGALGCRSRCSGGSPRPITQGEDDVVGVLVLHGATLVKRQRLQREKRDEVRHTDGAEALAAIREPTSDLTLDVVQSDETRPARLEGAELRASVL